jgi:tetratricopeptide (TPR) repeat protein
LEFYEKSLAMRKELGNKLDIACSLSNTGELYQEMGELEVAFDFFKQSLALREEIGNKLDIACSFFSLIDVTIDLEEIQQAKEYLSDLQLINKQEENKRVDLCSRLAEALILKMSKRRKNLTKAEGILEKIVEEAEEETIDHQLTVKALINLSELLLEELHATGEEEILEEVEEKVDKLLEIAKEQQSYILIAESYLLKAQLALVRLDLNEARNLLIQAQVIAEEKGLERLAHKISSEHDKLLEQLDQWEELIAKDASITERVKVANLEELMGWMARKREIKLEEKEDEPIMVLLVSESGLPIYSKQFDPTRDLQDMLISGFLASINTFVKEAFDVPGMIRRIMHDEYTLSFEVIKSILFCYVYEGLSYTAMKKLDNLITEVYETEMWSALEEVGKRGYKLKDGEIAQMDRVIGEIFITN